MQRCPNSKNRGVVCGEESHFVTLWETLFRTRRESVVDKGQSKVAGSIPTPSPPPGLGGGGRAGCGMYPQKWLTRVSIQRPFAVPLRPRPSKRTPVPPLSRRYQVHPCSLSLTLSRSLSVRPLATAVCSESSRNPPKKKKKKGQLDRRSGPGGVGGGILEGCGNPRKLWGAPQNEAPYRDA